MTHLDGNALAGLFADTVGIEITAAIGRCGSCHLVLSLIHISEPTRLSLVSRMPSSA